MISWISFFRTFLASLHALPSRACSSQLRACASSTFNDNCRGRSCDKNVFRSRWNLGRLYGLSQEWLTLIIILMQKLWLIDYVLQRQQIKINCSSIKLLQSLKKAVTGSKNWSQFVPRFAKCSKIVTKLETDFWRGTRRTLFLQNILAKNSAR